MDRARIISIVIEPGDAGLFHASSPEMQELFVSGRTIEDVKLAVPQVIEAIYRAHGTDVHVVEAEAGAELYAPWVVLPKEALAAHR